MAMARARLWGCVAAIIALTAPLSVLAQELWNGLRLGMTQADVQTAFPKARQGERTIDGDDTVLRVPGLSAGGHDATAFLDFTRGQLRTVELLLSAGRAGGTIDTEEVKTQLSSKYGPPVECQEDRERCEWRNGGVDITLIATPVAGAADAEILYGTFAASMRTAHPSAPTPVALVRAFYDDLGAGDGDQASELVAPQKRERGPFSPQALTRFYSSLPEPIRLVNAYPHSGGSVFVRYRFTAAGGHVCDGNADVKTAWVGERLLIESIHSYSGC